MKIMKMKRINRTSKKREKEPEAPPGFDPEWRSHLAHNYVNQGWERPSGIPSLRPLDFERDEDVRQYFLFLKEGQCENEASFRFAQQVSAQNPIRGLGSLIGAMAVAGYSADEIGKYLKVPALHITTYSRLFWAEPTYGRNEFRVEALSRQCTTAADGLEHSLLLAAGGGRKSGLMQLLTPDVALTGSERQRVQSILDRFKARLERDGIRVTPEELEASRWEGIYFYLLRRHLSLPPEISAKSRVERFSEVMAAVSTGEPVSSFVRLPKLCPF